jgi:hypothetical protein
MTGQQVRRVLSNAAETVIRFAVKAINAVRHGKALLLAAFAALLLVAAVPLSFRIGTRPVAASSTLKCYDSAGNYEPCLAQAGASAPPSAGRTTEAHQPASWTTIALHRQESWVTSALAQPASWTMSPPPVARRSAPSARRPESAVCGHRFIPCFFSALRRGVTHIAYAAASAARARPAREYH